ISYPRNCPESLAQGLTPFHQCLALLTSKTSQAEAEQLSTHSYLDRSLPGWLYYRRYFEQLGKNDENYDVILSREEKIKHSPGTPSHQPQLRLQLDRPDLFPAWQCG